MAEQPEMADGVQVLPSATTWSQSENSTKCAATRNDTGFTPCTRVFFVF